MQTEIVRRISYGGLKDVYDVDLFRSQHLIGLNRMLIHNLGSRVEQILLKNIEMTTRQHKLFFFFLSPEIVKHTYHYQLETWQPGTTNWNVPLEKLLMDFEKYWQYTRSVIWDHRPSAFGSVITEKPKNVEFLLEYEKRKDKFVTSVRGRTGTKREEYLRLKASELIENEPFFRQYIFAKNKNFKGVIASMHMSGEMMSTTERRNFVDYIDYLIATTPSYMDKLQRIKRELGIVDDVEEKKKRKSR